MAGQNVGSSNLRLARSQMDQLEADLWTWRNKCKASGKKIPKRLVQARAKWAFQKQGIPDFKASDGWYWKWLSKWKKRSKSHDQDRLIGAETDDCLSVATEESSHNPLVQMDCEEESANLSSSNDQNRRSTNESQEPEVARTSLAKETLIAPAVDTIASSSSQNNVEADNVAFWLPSSESDSDEDLLSSLSSQYLLSQTDILPLVMNDGEVSLDPQPTQSTLPISPIFIASSSARGSASDQENGSKQDLMPPDLASVDLDTLLMPPEVTVKQPQENDFMDLTNSSEVWSSSSGSPASSLKENFEPEPEIGPEVVVPNPAKSPEPTSKKLTVIARHRRLGEESLSKLKEEVRKYALDHTFKETAKKFGIHHSTVSGWVKAREKVATRHTLALMKNKAFSGTPLTMNIGTTSVVGPEKADEVFIAWLKSMRENNYSITLPKVKEKVAELFQTFGTTNIEKTCKWFLLWNNRREEKQYVEGMEDEEICRRETPNLAYPPAFKLEVALHAQKYSQYAAAKIFSVARRRIFDWMRQISKLQELIAKGHMKKMTGRGPKNRDIDQALYEWYSQRRAAGERPRSCEVQSRAREIYRARGYTDMKCSYGWFKRWSQRFHIQLRYSYDDELLEWILAKFDANMNVNHHDLQNHGLNLVRKEDPHFKASSGWALRFCKRHTDYLNPDFSVGAKLPDHLEERASRFRVVLQQLIKEKNFSPPQIGCMDELPLNLSPSLRDKRIGPGILLKHHGLQGAQATVFLTMTANGKLLPPLLVLKGEQKLINIPGCEVIVVISNNDSNNEVGASSLQERMMNQWQNLVWFSHVPKSSLLLADSFHTHTNSFIQKSMVNRGACLAIIPSACSQKLQPLHRGIKLKFKEYIECMYLKNLDTSSTSDVSNSDIVAWVDQAYKMLKHQKDDIEASFKQTEILPSL